MKLRYFFDWGGDFLWAADWEAEEKYGYPADTDIMPLSKTTRELAGHLAEMNEQCVSARDEDERAELWREYYRLGDELYLRLVSELGPGVEVLNELKPA